MGVAEARLAEGEWRQASQRRATGESGERSSQPLPYGCLTGVAKDVLHNIRRAAVGSRAKDFLTLMATLSFGDAGRAQRRGEREPGLTCAFQLAAWAQELGWHKSDVLRIRKQLIDLQVVSFAAETARPGEGTLRWNIDFASWRALDAEYRRSRYMRLNAGRKPRQAPVVTVGGAAQQAGIGDVISANAQRVGSLIPAAESNCLQDRFKLPMGACSKSQHSPTRRDALRREKNVLVENEEADVDVGVAPTAASGADTQHSSHVPEAGALRQGVPSLKPVVGSTPGEQAYITALIREMRARLHVRELPAEERERRAARWFFRARDGSAAPLEEILAFYDAMKRTAFWAGRYLSLEHVEGPYAEHHGDLDAHRAMEWSRQEQERSGRNGHSGRSGRSRGTGAGQRGAPGAASGGGGEATTSRTGKYASVYNVIRREVA